MAVHRHRGAAGRPAPRPRNLGEGEPAAGLRVGARLSGGSRVAPAQRHRLDLGPQERISSIEAPFEPAPFPRRPGRRRSPRGGHRRGQGGSGRPGRRGLRAPGNGQRRRAGRRAPTHPAAARTGAERSPHPRSDPGHPGKPAAGPALRPDPGQDGRPTLPPGPGPGFRDRGRPAPGAGRRRGCRPVMAPGRGLRRSGRRSIARSPGRRPPRPPRRGGLGRCPADQGRTNHRRAKLPGARRGAGGQRPRAARPDDRLCRSTHRGREKARRPLAPDPRHRGHRHGRQLLRSSGGDSLSGLQVVKGIKSELGIEIPEVSVFENPTVAAIARLVEAESDSTSAFEQARKKGAQRRARRRPRQRARQGESK